MKPILFLFVCFSVLSFKTDPAKTDFNFLYQNWHIYQYKAGDINEITYHSSKKFGNDYGYQFRKNGTMTISRSVHKLPRGMHPNFEEVEGEWKIIQDSILKISYESNNKSYDEELIVRQLNANELIVHLKTTNQ